MGLHRRPATGSSVQPRAGRWRWRG
jgi:hypothetical protein